MYWAAHPHKELFKRQLVDDFVLVALLGVRKRVGCFLFGDDELHVEALAMILQWCMYAKRIKPRMSEPKSCICILPIT
jgi:hypothetical protein